MYMDAFKDWRGKAVSQLVDIGAYGCFLDAN